MQENVLKLLRNLGFTEYEAKTYLALLQQSPLTGYAVARISRVPRSKIYEVLGNLVERGDVLVSYGEPVQYAPKPPKELLASRRHALEQQFAEAEKGLEDFLGKNTPTDLIWDIRGREEILFRMREVIGRAKQQILLQIWEEDAPELRESLLAAAQRGVTITVVAYGEPDFPFARVYLHEPGAEEIAHEFGGRWIILSIDGQEIVAGIVSLGKESTAAWSSHVGIVMPITEQIKHDLYIVEMLHTHRDILETSFGPVLRDLRREFGPSTTVYRPRQKSDRDL
ncbi:putative cyclodextrin metabolism protein YrhO [Candidatus Vecturithrix granuli]|uniref:Putative cyclodextrin metabolism protein YrhO n=1 Tax=Vecturithrix granuli TaxID=1499967 RepID=A0A081C3G4_VECG1|nr:putative cyclodextrin metabolism protein YrhO [Candidatus Vecturithrix granuli]